MIVRARVAPAHRHQLAPDAVPNPRDRRRREELTLERQHHDDHPGSSHTGARRTPATSPNLHTPGPRTSPASPTPLEPRLELLQTAMEEQEGEARRWYGPSLWLGRESPWMPPSTGMPGGVRGQGFVHRFQRRRVDRWLPAHSSHSLGHWHSIQCPPLGRSDRSCISLCRIIG